MEYSSTTVTQDAPQMVFNFKHGFPLVPLVLFLHYLGWAVSIKTTIMAEPSRPVVYLPPYPALHGFPGRILRNVALCWILARI